MITLLGRPALNFVSFIFHNDLAGRAVRRSPQTVPLSESALAYAGRGVQPGVVNVDDEVFAVGVKAVNASIVFELLNNVFADSGGILRCAAGLLRVAAAAKSEKNRLADRWRG